VSQAIAHAFLLALRTGMRAGEICSLRWDQVKQGYLARVGTKTVPRDVPISKKAARLIEAMRGYDKELVIGVSPQSLDALFRKYRVRAGLDGFTFHDSRHTAATWIAQKLHILDLCKMFGWKNTKRALTYYNPSASDIADRL
jgi:integrase